MSGMFNSAGYNATTWDSIGILKIYASESINGMFYGCRHAKATLNLYTNSSNYSNALSGAAVSEDDVLMKIKG